MNLRNDTLVGQFRRFDERTELFPLLPAPIRLETLYF